MSPNASSQKKDGRRLRKREREKGPDLGNRSLEDRSHRRLCRDRIGNGYSSFAKSYGARLPRAEEAWVNNYRHRGTRPVVAESRSCPRLRLYLYTRSRLRRVLAP